MRPITEAEWNDYDWIDTHEGFFIRGLKKTEPPPAPDDGMKYILVEVTTFSDSERVYKWVPAVTVEG